MDLILGILFLIGIELAYFRIAKKFAIIDKPNERSSHLKPTIRGGGIIFPIAWLVFSLYNEGSYPWFTLGLLIISVVSFIDDIKALPVRVRFFVHLLAFSLLFYELNLFELLPVWGSMLALILCIGMVNAINFMDGINGMTGLYALSFFGVMLFYWHSDSDSPSIHLFGHNPFVFIVISILVFGFFNFRKKALCFAGDVGSVSIGFILLFFMSMLFFTLTSVTFPERPLKREVEFNPEFVLFLAVYGVDSILTIFHRLILKENIFKAHRRHLYQYLSNELGWPHLMVALLYAALQSIINYRLVSHGYTLVQAFALLIALSITYVLAKYAIINRKRVLSKNG